MTSGKRVRQQKKDGIRLPPDLKAERRAEFQQLAQTRADTVGKARAIRDKAVRIADEAYTKVVVEANSEHTRKRSQTVTRYENKAKERYEPKEEPEAEAA